jgi:Zn-dependent peptidase ImmA (M78 family)
MIIVTYQDLPPSVPAVVQQNPDDSYTIIINDNLSDEKKRLAMKHELNHIVGDDLFGYVTTNS